MNESRQIPTEIRDDFAPIDVIDEHPAFFARPTRPVLGIDYEARLDAVQQISHEPADAISRNPAFGFALEAQIDALEEVLERLARAHPNSFRQIERGFDLLENMHVMLCGGPAR